MRAALSCVRCAAPVDAPGWHWRCASCEGPLDFDEEPELEEIVSLGEPATPLVEVPLDGLTVTAKLEGALPTGSFKDRGSRVVASALREYGVRRAVIDSSGNAGASLAAYCARAGIACEVYAPASASATKLAQIRAYGARVVPVDGSRQDVTAAAVSAAESAAYASHAWTPWFLHGTTTFADELYRQLGRAPDAIVVPVGAGTLLLGVARGFAALARRGAVEGVPRIYGVQSSACAPLALAFERGLDAPVAVDVGDTAAEGIKIASPPRGAEVIAAVRASGGTIVSVGEQDLWCAYDRLAAQGVLVEPTSAPAFAAAERLRLRAGEVTVIPVTATGLKAPVLSGPLPLLPIELG
jgi:threonine synthase